MKYKLPEDKNHLGLLVKFQKLKGKTLKGNELIKGNKDSRGLQPDKYVNYVHRLHDQIRGIYKPKELECMLSYKATESEDNYGKQIIWENDNKIQFKEIILRPPNGENDNRKISDINAANYAMNNKIPIGIFENVAKGINKVLGLGVIESVDENGFYHIIPIDLDLEEIERVFEMGNTETNYFTFRTNDKDFVINSFLNEEVDEVEFENIPNYFEETKDGDIVLIVLGGDKPSWELGLRGIGRVIGNPYERGYNQQKPKYYKLKVKKELVFNNSLSREKMVPYKSLYNMIFIGPMLKGEPNQLNVKAEENQIISVIRAILDYFPKYRDKLIEIFGIDMIHRADNVKDIYKLQDSQNNKITRSINNIHLKELEIIESYINNKGFIYSKEYLSNFYLSLKSKPFVILAGISGTGKSRLVRLFAEAINAKFKIIPVKPDWNDSTELLGYKNIKDKFVQGQLYKVIDEAKDNLDTPYFVCLDEMNLARVEYYLSEYLSVIESRKFEKGKIVTDELFSESYFEKIEDTNISIPENLYIIGTVNMDDTTFSFSRKVLDRANTIEFSEVDLETLDFLTDEAETLVVDNSLLKTQFLNIKDALEIDRTYVEEINEKIVEINNILKPYSKHFGYRVRDEIVFYMLENKLANLLEEDMAFDYQIMQKILPTIIGSDVYIEEILIKLFKICTGFNLENKQNYIKEAESVIKNESEKCRYPKSATKILQMLKGYRDGFVSFWQ